MSNLSLFEQAGILTGLISGIGGLVLGIVNAIHQWRDVSPRIRVRPFVRHLVTRFAVASDRNKVEQNVAVMELSNLGRIPVRGSSIGFEGKATDGAFVLTPEAIDEKPWPGPIDPGESRYLRMDLVSAKEVVLSRGMQRAIMTSQVGDVFRSSRKDMRRFKQALREAQSGGQAGG